jgi:hypothetical protein
MNQEYYIGQIFEGKYPPMAAVWCNQNNAFIEKIGDNRYEIKAVPPAPAPTREEIERARIAYRREHIDDETLCRLRKQANGTWTQEKEDAYLALDAEVTAYIEEHLPYPTDPITE